MALAGSLQELAVAGCREGAEDGAAQLLSAAATSGQLQLLDIRGVHLGTQVRLPAVPAAFASYWG
jgi:hypothetical protein